MFSLFSISFTCFELKFKSSIQIFLRTLFVVCSGWVWEPQPQDTCDRYPLIENVCSSKSVQFSPSGLLRSLITAWTRIPMVGVCGRCVCVESTRAILVRDVGQAPKFPKTLDSGRKLFIQIIARFFGRPEIGCSRVVEEQTKCTAKN